MTASMSGRTAGLRSRLGYDSTGNAFNGTIEGIALEISKGNEFNGVGQVGLDRYRRGREEGRPLDFRRRAISARYGAAIRRQEWLRMIHFHDLFFRSRIAGRSH
jgi:hypothetical protein